MKRVYTMIYLVCYLKEIKALRAKSASLNPMEIKLFHYAAFKAGISKQTDKFSFYCKLAYLGSKTI